MSAYQIFLQTHSGIRWLVLLAALIVIIKSLIGYFGKGQYGKLDNILSASFTGFVHLQLLLGLILYFFLSPFTKAAFQNFGAAMGDSNLRFWAVEHITVMVLAAVAAQIGRSISKKAEDGVVKFRFQAIFYSLALLLILVGIPWDRL